MLGKTKFLFLGVALFFTGFLLSQLLVSSVMAGVGDSLSPEAVSLARRVALLENPRYSEIQQEIDKSYEAVPPPDDLDFFEKQREARTKLLDEMEKIEQGVDKEYAADQVEARYEAKAGTATMLGSAWWFLALTFLFTLLKIGGCILSVLAALDIFRDSTSSRFEGYAGAILGTLVVSSVIITDNLALPIFTNTVITGRSLGDAIEDIGGSRSPAPPLPPAPPELSTPPAPLTSPVAPENTP